MTAAELLTYLRQLNGVSMLVRLLLAALGGAIIGISRGRRQHAAGMRTHLLVCIGAASVMITSQFFVVQLGMPGDVMRMPAQVVSGIGFLGAGSILVTGTRHITGLTTAAGLWASACMGLAVGAGYYECAVVLCVFIYVILVGLNRLDEAHIKVSRRMMAYFELLEETPLSTLLIGLRYAGLTVRSMDAFGSHGYLLELELPGGIGHADVIEQAAKLPGIVFCEEIKV